MDSGRSDHDDGGWTVSKARELPEDEFTELADRIAFDLDLASQAD